jgi:hypothetical protein
MPQSLNCQTNSQAGANIRRLIHLLTQEFETLQQQHEATVRQQSCLLELARSGIDIEDAGKEEKAIDWPVLTFDIDTGETEVQLKKQSVGSVLSLMQQGGEKREQQTQGVHGESSIVGADGLQNEGKDILQQKQEVAKRATSRGSAGLPSHLASTPTPTRKTMQEGGVKFLDITPIGNGSRLSGQATCETPPARQRPQCAPLASPLSGHIEEPQCVATPCSKAESIATGNSSISKVINVDSLNRFSKKLLRLGSGTSLNSSSGTYYQRRLRAIYKNPWFELSFAVIILLNSIVMCIEYQYYGNLLGHHLEFKGWEKSEVDWRRAGHKGAAQQVFAVLEWIFGVAFSLELIFKFAALSVSVFKDLWNYIDFVTVGFFLFEKSFGMLFPTGSQWIRICRLARLTRLIKLVRTVEGFDHLYLMTTALKGSVKILAWALALMLLIQITIALIVGQILQVVYFEDSTKTIEKQHEIYEYFGTFSRSLLTMFEMTLANWPPVCRLLSEEVSEWFMLLCVAHKLTIGFAVVGVINGVFMQETFKVASSDDVIMVRQKEKAAQKHHRNMKDLFNALDGSGDGHVNLKEFCALATVPSVKAWLASMDIRTDDLETMFHLMDGDKSGHITFEEMLSGMERLKGHARSVDLFALHAASNVTTL